MAQNPLYFEVMSLFTHAGERKYLSSVERKRFFDSLSVLANPKERSFCETLYWTGCRISEALQLNAINIDVGEGCVIIRSLKKRGKLKGRHFRAVPVPDDFLERLEIIHEIRSTQKQPDFGAHNKLWNFKRTKGWEIVKTVMREADISGVKACPKGLRHTLGVHGIVNDIPEARISSWMGHASRKTTEIYLNAVGPEDRLIAERMWQEAEQ